MITSPAGMKLPDWADQITFELSSYGNIGRIIGADWQDWGVQIINNTSVGRRVPNPYGFNDWVVWGERLCEALA